MFYEFTYFKSSVFDTKRVRHNEIQLYVFETFDEKEIVMVVFDDMCNELLFPHSQWYPMLVVDTFNCGDFNINLQNKVDFIK